MSLLEEIKISGCDKLRMALCRCVLKLGATTKRSVTRLGVNISEAEWRMCKRKVAGLPDIPKKKRGRPNKIDNPVLIVAVRNALASMSHDSCRLRMSKADRRDAKGRKLVLQIKTLKGSKRTIFAKKLSTMLMSFKRSSMYNIAGKHCYEYARAKNRTDVCDICYLYDHHFLKQLKIVYGRHRSKLLSVMASEQVNVESDGFYDWLGKLVVFIGRHSDDQIARREVEVPYGKRLDLHNAEAAALTDLREAHEELRYFRWRFQTMARQAPVSKRSGSLSKGFRVPLGRDLLQTTL